MADTTAPFFGQMQQARLDELNARMAQYEERFDALGAEVRSLNERGLDAAMGRNGGRSVMDVQREAAALRIEIAPLEAELEALEEQKARAEKIFVP